MLIYNQCPDDFPTYVGMNRASTCRRGCTIRFPHLCGDEPTAHTPQGPQNIDFPTYVGMNRLGRSQQPCPDGFPHLCGDEPESAPASSAASQISPPMWG